MPSFSTKKQQTVEETRHCPLDLIVSENRRTHTMKAAESFAEAQAIWRHGQAKPASVRMAALRKYREAAQYGVPECQFYVGQILTDAEYPDTVNFKAGYRWILKAAMQGAPGAQYWIAVRLATGEGVRRNPRMAVKWYRKAARRGLAEAKYNLGIMYHEGDGVVRNGQRARYWIKRAAEQEDALAIMLLADAYATGELGFRINDRKAAYWRGRLTARPTRRAHNSR